MQQFTFYDFVCLDCKKYFNKGFWKNDGEWVETPSCIDCKSENLHQGKPTSMNKSTVIDAPVLNTRFDLHKQLPKQSKEFFNEFKTRHSKYGNTIKDF